MLGLQLPPPRVTPMNQVLVEAGTLEWVEQELSIEEPNNSQAKMEEEMKMINVISHYVLHGEQHIPVYETVPVNPKARDMNATSMSLPIQFTNVEVYTRPMNVLTEAN